MRPVLPRELPRSGALLLLALLTAGLSAAALRGDDRKDANSTGPIAHGLRVFSCGHSFHVFVPGILADMAKKAGIKDHKQVGLSSLGGSRVIQHWDQPDEKFKVKPALREGKVDVLTL